jgi:hypothetical protein
MCWLCMLSNYYVKITTVAGAAVGYAYAAHHASARVVEEHRSKCNFAETQQHFNDISSSSCKDCHPNLYTEVPIYSFAGAVAGPFALPAALVYGPAKLYSALTARWPSRHELSLEERQAIYVEQRLNRKQSKQAPR